MRRLLPLLAVLAALAPVVVITPRALATEPRQGATTTSCAHRILVMGSLPAEIDPVLAAARLDPGQPVTRSGRHFFLGTLAGHRVIMGMVGIGLVNARQMTQAAFAGFRCGRSSAITSVVYTGVAGAGRGSRIGDVTVPSRWTLDQGKTWLLSDPGFITTVRQHRVFLQRTAPLGSPGCACRNPDLVHTVTFPYQPKEIVGGNGQSYDTFGGHAFPCVPGGGDLFGCEPCPNVLGSPSDAPRAASDAAAIANLQFFVANLGPAASPSEVDYEASDNETAEVDLVAHQNRVPFIAFRAISDGTPDPLHLPGYPSQFFAYYQLAADNAAHSAVGLVAALPRTLG